MTPQLIQGRALASQLQLEIAEKIKARRKKGQRPPGLAVIIVGDDPASRIYVHRKQEAALSVGMYARLIELKSSCSEADLLEAIEELNADPLIDGFLVQMPLPAHIDMHRVIDRIAPHKDVDGFHPLNVGRLAQNRALLRPCTPRGVMVLLAHYGVSISGKNAVIVGTSQIVGRPLSMELLHAGATVTLCHRKTQDLAQHTCQADLLVSATGVPNLIRAGHVKKGAIVIDIGITRLPDGRVIGDVDFKSVAPLAGLITPVPGGVGPMTVTMLLQNTWIAAEES
jgi:methylenetetrahydrofolate dehydrogenase (NADP+)/methenyltetrahydrofolate cyclohydrolase